MKNPYAKETHFSKRKFRQFLKMFCNDFTALQIASLLNINRNTANLWINRIRRRILELSELERLQNASLVQMDETFFNGSGSIVKPDWLPVREIVVFGIIDEHGKVYARIVEKANKENIIPIIQSCCSDGAVIYTDGGSVYKGLGNIGYKHSFISHTDKEFSRLENGACVTTNRIEGFWGWMKVRLSKFRGVKWNSMDLHVAESVWRFNHRRDDIYKILLRQLRDVML